MKKPHITIVVLLFVACLVWVNGASPFKNQRVKAAVAQQAALKLPLQNPRIVMKKERRLR